MVLYLSFLQLASRCLEARLPAESIPWNATSGTPRQLDTQMSSKLEHRAISAIVRLHLVQLASDQPRSARLQDVSQSDSSARFPSGVSPFDPVAVDD